MEIFSTLKLGTSLPLARLKSHYSAPLIPRRNPNFFNGNSSYFNYFIGFPKHQFTPKLVFRGQNRSLSCKTSQWIQRNVIVRSQIATAGCPSDDTRSSAGVELGSRVRGICFYALTALTAVPLFGVMVLVHPFLMIFDRHRRRVHHMIAKAWATLTISPFFKFEFEGLDNLPPVNVPAVYVSNHRSFLDTYTLLTLGRSFKFISKRSIFVIPIIGWAMFLMGLIPLRRMDSRSQLECLKRCMDSLRQGASVFFFPEGTRSKDGKLGSFKKGAFSVAAKTESPVVPITLLGTGELMASGMEGKLNSGSVKVVIHKPIKGTNAEALCRETRNVIADTLIRHGYGIHYD